RPPLHARTTLGDAHHLNPAAGVARRANTTPAWSVVVGHVDQAGRAVVDSATVKALLLENIHSEAVRALTNRGYEIETAAGALGEDELIAALGGVDMLGIRSRTHVTRRVLEAAPQLSAIGAF